MATMPKMSGASDTRRSTAEFTVSAESGRALVNAAETWFTAAAAPS